MRAALRDDFRRHAKLANDAELAPHQVRELLARRRRRCVRAEGCQSRAQSLHLGGVRVTLERGDFPIVNLDLIVQALRQ
jgi:hypothetical protein